MSETPSITVNKEIVSRVNQDGTVILMKMDEDNIFFKIDGIASQVWAKLTENLQISQIIEDIISEYEVSIETVNKDVNALIDELRKRELVD